LNKRAAGDWVFGAFKVLAKFKTLRGGAFDVFGKTEERRMERALRDSYEADVIAMLATLSAQTHDIAVKIAEIPDQIRGFGHVKEASVIKAAQYRATLKAAFDTAAKAPVHAPQAAE
jgi:indolepyruvate ferredoxin oxidoreductase